MSFTALFIANRGEIAIRIARAAAGGGDSLSIRRCCFDPSESATWAPTRFAFTSRYVFRGRNSAKLTA